MEFVKMLDPKTLGGFTQMIVLLLLVSALIFFEYSGIEYSDLFQTVVASVVFYWFGKQSERVKQNGNTGKNN